MRGKVETELKKLVAAGLLVPTTVSDWGSLLVQLVVIPRSDGTVRLCVDYKSTVNPQLVDTNFPILQIDETLSRIQGSKIFCKLDIYLAYLHLPVSYTHLTLPTIYSV